MKKSAASLDKVLLRFATHSPTSPNSALHARPLEIEVTFQVSLELSMPQEAATITRSQWWRLCRGPDQQWLSWHQAQPMLESWLVCMKRRMRLTDQEPSEHIAHELLAFKPHRTSLAKCKTVTEGHTSSLATLASTRRAHILYSCLVVAEVDSIEGNTAREDSNCLILLAVLVLQTCLRGLSHQIKNV
eukprot:2419639-Amphidinium_carterae.1